MKALLLQFITLTAFVYSATAQTITFTDLNFKNALINYVPKIDLNNNGEIEVSEAEFITQLDVSNKDIQSLNGIEAFINLSVLNCSNNSLLYINLINQKLTSLICSYNEISTLGIESLVNLKYLNCEANFIKDLRIGTIDSLLTLICSDNPLNKLDLYTNPTIQEITATSCQLEWVDVSTLENLTWFVCNGNNIKTLDLTKNKKLRFIDCGGNELTNLDLSNNPELTEIDIYSNLFTSFDFSDNLKVAYIIANYNPLTQVDLSCLPVFNAFECYNCNLKSLDLRGNAENLYLDVRGNDSLTTVCIETSQSFGYLDREENTQISTECAKGIGKCSIITNLDNNLTFNKTLIKTVDLQGREVDQNSTGLVIEFYTDGSKEKIWRQ